MKKNIKAFTLIELVVVTAIIAIIATAVINLNFTSQVDKQKWMDSSNMIFNQINKVKTESLLWKWIWEDLIFPDERIIKINTWNLITWYLSGWINIELENSIFLENFEIDNIKCFDYNKVNSWSINSIDLIFRWYDLSFSWCDNSFSGAILEFETKYKKQNINKFYINSISWILKKN